MSKAVYMLGVDGGGSRSEAVLECLQTQSKVVLMGGPLNSITDGEQQASRNLLQLFEAVSLFLEESGSELAAASIATACNTGRDRQSHWSVELARSYFPNSGVIGMEDTEAALEGALEGEPGIMIIAGTGSASLALTPQGAVQECGGWGPWFGDEGSGYWIGCEALRAVAKAIDRRGGSTELCGYLQTAMQQNIPLNRDVIVRKVYGEWGRREIASLSRHVAAAAHDGDAVSLHILEQAAQMLAEQAGTLHALVEWNDKVPILAGVGGIFTMGDLIMIPFREHLDRMIPPERYRLQKPRLTPAEGAINKARREL